MCSLQYATQLEKKNAQENKGVTITHEKINQLNEMIENHMAAF
jgi:Cu/Ag efflux protein CusF